MRKQARTEMSQHLDGKFIKLLIDICHKKNCIFMREQDYENRERLTQIFVLVRTHGSNVSLSQEPMTK